MTETPVWAEVSEPGSESQEDHFQWGIRWPNGRVHPIVGTRERADLIVARDRPGGEVVSRVVGPWVPVSR